MRLRHLGWNAVSIIVASIGGLAAWWSRPYFPLRSPNSIGCYGLLGRPLRVGIVSWPGYAGGIVANNGFRPNTDSIYYRNHNLCVQFMLMEDVDTRAKAFARGGADGVDIVWSTVDFWANELPGFQKNHIMARAVMQVDWSRGADAIVADDSIQRIEDLYQKRISLALFTPSHWLLEYSIENSSLTESQQTQIVKGLIGTSASPDARANFVAGKVDAAAVWEPDVTEALFKRPRSHILASSSQARKLIANLMVAREDFIRSHPDVLQAFIEGWLVDGTEAANRDPGNVVKLLMENESLYRDLGSEVTWRSLSTVKWANLADNTEMFNLDNKDAQPLFDRIYAQAARSWVARGYISAPVTAQTAKDDGFLRSLYQRTPVARIPDFLPLPPLDLKTKPPLTTRYLSVNFDVYSAVLDADGARTIDQVSTLPQAWSGSYIRVEGNTDNRGNPTANRALSKRRAQAVVDYLVSKYHLPENQFIAVGNGPDKPIASNESAQGRAKNRRIDISVIHP